MSDDLVEQAIKELQELCRCVCHEAYTGRGLHDPNCDCDSAPAVKVVADRIEELQAKRDAAVAAAYEDAAKVGVDYVNGDLAQPEMGIWWNIMQRAPADSTGALERVKRQARNEALEEAAERVRHFYDKGQITKPSDISAMMEDDDR